MRFTLLVLVCLPVCLLAGGNMSNKVSPLVPLSSDSSINGYYYEPAMISPFDYLIRVGFNLPETSTVDLFLCDTLGLDTSWICHQVPFPPGFYELPAETLIAIRDSKTYEIFDVNLTATSRYRVGANVSSATCSFGATQRVAVWRTPK